MTPEEKAQFEEMKQFIENLKKSESIPRDVETAFLERLPVGLALSSKSASSENKTVNESGSTTYSVLLPPDGFLQIRVNGTLYYIPTFT